MIRINNKTNKDNFFNKAWEKIKFQVKALEEKVSFGERNGNIIKRCMA